MPARMPGRHKCKISLIILFLLYYFLVITKPLIIIDEGPHLISSESQSSEGDSFDNDTDQGWAPPSLILRWSENSLKPPIRLTSGSILFYLCKRVPWPIPFNPGQPRFISVHFRHSCPACLTK